MAVAYDFLKKIGETGSVKARLRQVKYDFVSVGWKRVLFEPLDRADFESVALILEPYINSLMENLHEKFAC